MKAAAIAIPGVSSWAAYKERARLKVGETVLVNGASDAVPIRFVQVGAVSAPFDRLLHCVGELLRVTTSAGSKSRPNPSLCQKPSRHGPRIKAPGVMCLLWRCGSLDPR
jgi:hypothetical protein